MKAQNDVALVAGEIDVALLMSNPPTRARPRFIENEPEIGIWIHTAGRLDWLRSEIAQR